MAERRRYRGGGDGLLPPPARPAPAPPPHPPRTRLTPQRTRRFPSFGFSPQLAFGEADPQPPLPRLAAAGWPEAGRLGEIPSPFHNKSVWRLPCLVCPSSPPQAPTVRNTQTSNSFRWFCGGVCCFLGFFSRGLQKALGKAEGGDAGGAAERSGRRNFGSRRNPDGRQSCPPSGPRGQSFKTGPVRGRGLKQVTSRSPVQAKRIFTSVLRSWRYFLMVQSTRLVLGAASTGNTNGPASPLCGSDPGVFSTLKFHFKRSFLHPPQTLASKHTACKGAPHHVKRSSENCLASQSVPSGD